MNYQAHYDRLVHRARFRTLNGYCERHHIIPRCMGGGGETSNIVKLTAEEHYVAHQLLVKMCPDESGLVHALIRMAHLYPNNKIYGWIRRRHSVAMSKLQTGRRHTEAAKRKMSLSKKGKPLPRTPEWTEKIAASNRGKKLSLAHCRCLRSSQAWNPGNRGKKFTEEHRAKIGAASRGRKPRLGHRNSPQHNARIAAALRGVPKSAETCAKISASCKAYFEARRVA